MKEIVMSNDICPCKGCEAPKRYPGCHDKCPGYIDWNSRHLIRKEEIYAAKGIDNMVEDILMIRASKNAQIRKQVEKSRGKYKT
jgi:hypothetical protein